MFQVKVDANNLRKNFGDAQQRFLEGLQSGLNEGALVIEKAAKEKAPEETGDLRQSIQSEVEMQGSKGTAKVYTNNQYAIYVHEGTGIHSRTGMGARRCPGRTRTTRPACSCAPPACTPRRSWRKRRPKTARRWCKSCAKRSKREWEGDAWRRYSA